MTSTNQTVQRSSSSDSVSLFAAAIRKPMTALEDTGFASFLADTATSDQTIDARRNEARAADSRNDRNDANTRAQSERSNDAKSSDNMKSDAANTTNVTTADPALTDTQPAATTAQTYQHEAKGDAATDTANEAAPAKAPAKQTTETTAKASDEKPVAADAVTTDSPAAIIATEPVIAPEAAPITSKPETDNKEALPTAADAPQTDNANAVAVVEVTAPLVSQKSAAEKTDTLTLETKSATAPAPAPELPALKAAADAAAGNAGDATAGDETLGDAADLTDAGGNPIKSLGHETAKAMADSKSETRDAAKTDLTQAAIAPVQASAQNARSAATASSVATAEVEGVTTTSTSAGGNNALMASTLGSNATGSATTIRIGTLPGQTAPTQVPAMAIALQMAKNLQKGSSSFEIRLDPAEMGRIDVRMEVRQDGHITAHMTVDRPETLDLLQRDSRALQQALNDAGLQADADSLNFSLRDQNAGSNSGNGMADSSPNYGSGTNDKAETPVISAPLYNINLSANGGVDIRI